MRPARFETTLKTLLQQAGGPVQDVRTVSEAGYDRHPYGLVVTYATGARVVLQFVQTSAPGDSDFSKPEQIIEGDSAPTPMPMPDDLIDGGRLQLRAVDRHLAALVTASGSREVRSAEAFSTRDSKGAIEYGLKIEYHDDSTIYVYVVDALPQGRDLQPGREYQVPAAV
ncbi:hypothetical protein [Streptomyces phytophilus]|uniref:hypothetical protein n=1 Tax=Streptomyces phytophilus TaxID=722715 RepID=UPI0015F08ACC|nr:hypothetical protein [Streptomyces phytophilus]